MGCPQFSQKQTCVCCVFYIVAYRPKSKEPYSCLDIDILVSKYGSGPTRMFYNLPRKKFKCDHFDSFIMPTEKHFTFHFLDSQPTNGLFIVAK